MGKIDETKTYVQHFSMSECGVGWTRAIWQMSVGPQENLRPNDPRHEHLSLCPPVHISVSLSFNQPSHYIVCLSICLLQPFFEYFFVLCINFLLSPQLLFPLYILNTLTLQSVLHMSFIILQAHNPASALPTSKHGMPFQLRCSRSLISINQRGKMREIMIHRFFPTEKLQHIFFTKLG